MKQINDFIENHFFFFGNSIVNINYASSSSHSIFCTPSKKIPKWIEFIDPIRRISVSWATNFQGTLKLLREQMNFLFQIFTGTSRMVEDFVTSQFQPQKFFLKRRFSRAVR